MARNTLLAGICLALGFIMASTPVLAQVTPANQHMVRGNQPGFAGGIGYPGYGSPYYGGNPGYGSGGYYGGGYPGGIPGGYPGGYPGGFPGGYPGMYPEPISYALMRLVPGAVGALAGFALGGAFGTIGRLLGGFVGFVAGRAIGDVLFPSYGGGYNPYVGGSFGVFNPGFNRAVNPIYQNYNGSMGVPNAGIGAAYGGGALYNPAAGGMIAPYYSGTRTGGVSTATGATGIPTTGGVSVRPASSSSVPAAPGLSDASLASLRDAFYKAVREYQETLKTGTEAEKQAAKARFDKAYAAYQSAKGSAR